MLGTAPSGVPSADGDLLGSATVNPNVQVSPETPTLRTTPEGYNQGHAQQRSDTLEQENAQANTQAGTQANELGLDTANQAQATQSNQSNEFEETGDPALDASIRVLQQNGLTEALAMDAMKEALESGDASKINKQLLLEKLGETYGQLAGVIAEQYFNHVSNSTAQAEQVIYDIAGGQQNWERYASTFKTNAPEYLQKIVKQQLDAGNYQDVGRLVSDFAKGSALVSVNNNILRPSHQMDVGLTKQQFLKEYELLKQEAEQRNDSLSAEPYYERLQQLHARRSIGKRRDGY